MVHPASNGVPRAPPYSGIDRSRSLFAYGRIAFYARPFQAHSAKIPVCDSFGLAWAARAYPTTPALQRPKAFTQRRFRLFPVRSPLLGESRLIYFPRGTEMFQFPRLASALQRMMRHDPHRVSPFGHRRIYGYLRLSDAYRSLSRPSSPSRAKAST